MVSEWVKEIKRKTKGAEQDRLGMLRMKSWIFDVKETFRWENWKKISHKRTHKKFRKRIKFYKLSLETVWLWFKGPFLKKVQTGRKAGKCFKGQTRRKERNKHSKVKENRCDGFRKSVLLNEKNLYFDAHCFMLPSSYVRVIAFAR